MRESTLRAVLESIERLGYRRSHAAAALVRGTPRTVALVVAHLTRPSTVGRVASALSVLEEQGYDTIVCNVDAPVERDRVDRRDPADESALRDFVSQHLRDLLIRRYRRVRVDHTGQHSR